MGKLGLKGMKFYAYHGCFEQERVIGNWFIVDFEGETDMSGPMSSDNIEDAVNYQAIYNTIKEEMMITSHLLEHVAGRVVKRIGIEFPMISSIRITVSKMNPPLGGEVECSSVTIES